MNCIFDGHNDVLLRLMQSGQRAAVESFATGRDGAIDLPKAQKGGFLGGFFAHFVPSPMDLDEKFQAMANGHYNIALPEPIEWEDAISVIMQQNAILLELERQGILKIARNVADIHAAQRDGKMAAIFHIEGAEAIDADFHSLDVFYAAGLRSLGPVWSRPTIFGEGVPFCFPSTGDIGAGLTSHGKRLIQRCNALGIMVDLSHLNEAGFWDVARISDAPLVATHSNAHAVTPHARNLTDNQLRAIAESDGMVGLNFATAFLREDGQMEAATPLSSMLAHLDHLIGILGEDRVGLGSDYDGAVVPEAVKTVADLPALIEAMSAHGYDTALIEKICHKNWLRVLEKTWGEPNH